MYNINWYFYQKTVSKLKIPDFIPTLFNSRDDNLKLSMLYSIVVTNSNEGQGQVAPTWLVDFTG